MATATAMGVGLGYLLGWPVIAGVVFGLALSVASTVVPLKALQERHIVQTERGRIAFGCLIVEGLAMVLALVLLPVLAQMMGATPVVVEPGHEVVAAGDTWTILLITIFKVVAFIAFMLIVGGRSFRSCCTRAVFGA